MMRLPETSAKAARTVPQLGRRLKARDDTSLTIMRSPRSRGRCWENGNACSPVGYGLVRSSPVSPEEGLEGGVVSGAARLPISGGSLANFFIRSSSILYAFISAKPVLRVPLICVVLGERSRVAFWA